MRRKFLLFFALSFTAASLNAQIVPLGSQALKAASAQAAAGTAAAGAGTALAAGTTQALVKGVTQPVSAVAGVSPSHQILFGADNRAVSFIPKQGEDFQAALMRLEKMKRMVWKRISSAQEQRDLARLSLVPQTLSDQVSPALAQVYMPGDAEKFLANGFIVNYNGVKWIALSRHVGGQLGNIHLLKVVLQDGSEKEFLGEVEIAGRAGYHEADLDLIRIPAVLQDRVTALEIAAPDPELPAYSFGSVARDSAHNDFLPVKREIVDQNDMLIQMTHDFPGQNPQHPVGLNGYCGSPIIQVIDGQPRAVGIFTGYMDAASQTVPAMSYALDLPQAFSVLVDHPAQTRSLNFLGKHVDDIPYNHRLSSVTLADPNRVVAFERKLLVFPNKFSYENAEQIFFDQQLHSGDIILFTVESPSGPYTLEHIIP